MNDNLINSVTLPQFLIRKGIVPAHGYRNNNDDNQAVLSVVSIPVVLTLGSNNQLAYTNSMDRLFTNLRRANTGAAIYTKLDMEHYLLNLRAAIAADRYMRRAYGVLMNYDSLDSQKPMSLFKAMGLDYDSFKDNAANLRFFMNSNSKRLHSILAGKADILERTAWMFDHVFKDSNDAKAQDILFSLSSLWYWDWSNGNYDSAVVASSADSATLTGLSYATFISNITTMMNRITADNKVAYIAADMIKAYGLGQTDSYFTDVPESYTVQSLYNEEVLCEIQNIKITRPGYINVARTDSDHINEVVTVQISSGCLTENPGGTNAYVKTAPINFYKNNINVAEYAGATRLSYYGEITAGSSGTDTLTLLAYGTEVVSCINFVCSDAVNSYAYKLYNLRFSPFVAMNFTNIAGIEEVFRLRYCWSVCDWLPLFVSLFAYFADSSSGYYTDAGSYQLFDYNNYCILDSYQQFDNIHSACIYSLYYWPNVIKDQKVLTIGQ